MSPRNVNSSWVFSTYVEVILVAVSYRVSMISILHVCGGDPKCLDIKGEIEKYSPRMWR